VYTVRESPTLREVSGRPPRNAACAARRAQVKRAKAAMNVVLLAKKNGGSHLTEVLNSPWVSRLK
jgi:hypothetical protein